LRNLRAKPEKCLQPGEGIDPHPEIDDHKVRICTQVHGASVNPGHGNLRHSLLCGLTAAFQPRRLIIAPAPGGCKRWLCADEMIAHEKDAAVPQ
jgi:hypothetical protein